MSENRIKNNIKGSFTIVPNALVNQGDIKPVARFLFVYMASKPDGWKFYRAELSKGLGLSKETISKYLKILENTGWLINTGQDNKAGVFGGNGYIIQPYPKKQGTVDDSENLPYPKKPDTVKNRYGKNIAHIKKELKQVKSNLLKKEIELKEALEIISKKDIEIKSLKEKLEKEKNEFQKVAQKSFKENDLEQTERAKISKAWTEAQEVLSHLNTATGSSYKVIPNKCREIKDRLLEGHDMQDLIDLIDLKALEWKGTRFEQHLTPRNLFENNFDKYYQWLLKVRKNPNLLKQKNGNSEKSSGHNFDKDKAAIREEMFGKIF